MKSILTAGILVFSVSLLVGCGGGKKSTSPSLSLDDVPNLAECTLDQKMSLDTEGIAGNKPSDVGGRQCVNTNHSTMTEAEILAEFEAIRDMAVAGGRGSCKWTDGSGDGAGNMVLLTGTTCRNNNYYN